MDTREQVRMVVINEHTLGYALPHRNMAGILSTSALKGSPFSGCPLSAGGMIACDPKIDNVRTATRKDFEDFRVVIDGYLRNDGVYNYLIAD